MATAEPIDIPIKGDNEAIKIKSPHLAPFRKYNYSDGSSLYGEPITNALTKSGLMPLPENLAGRLAEAKPFVRLVQGKATDYYYQREHKISEHWLNRMIDELSRGVKPDFLGSTIECLFRRVFRPDDFTLGQKIALFDHFSAEVLRHSEYEYDATISRGYGSSPVWLVSENCTLEEWKNTLRKRSDETLARWLEAQKAIRNLGGYDWRPLDFIFGSHLQTLIQLKAVELNAELKASYDTMMREYHDFLEAVEKASQLGAMRANTTQLDSLLLGKYKVWLYIRDVGKGAAFVGDINYHVVEPVKDVVSIFTSTFKFLFGERK